MYISTEKTSCVHVYIYRMRLVVYIYRKRLVVYIYRMRLLYISTEWDWLCTCLYLRNETAWVHVAYISTEWDCCIYLQNETGCIYLQNETVVYMYISTEWDWLYISTEWDWLWHGLWHDPLCKYISTEWDWLYLQNEIGLCTCISTEWDWLRHGLWHAPVVWARQCAPWVVPAQHSSPNWCDRCQHQVRQTIRAVSHCEFTRDHLVCIYNNCFVLRVFWVQKLSIFITGVMLLWSYIVM